MVGALVARGGRSHVAHHHIGPAAEPALHLLVRIVGQEIELVDLGPGDRLHLLKIDPQHRALRLVLLLAKRVHPLDGDLTPAAGRAAEVHHPASGLEEAELVVQLEDLVGGPAPEPLLFGADDIGIVQLPFEPERRGQLAPLRRLHPHAQLALSPARCVLGCHL
uniref:Uncharacterized protein n=1 Tax=Cereibacter sphaeroides (strain ATCC 17025 / ATH 2.4.3) TaxID=349102 RepID=A4WRB9_CERS5